MAVYIYPQAHTPPEIISLAKAKLQLKIDDAFTVDDTLIQDCIDAAINAAENYTGIDINQAKYQVKSNSFIQGLVINKSPIQSVDSVVYVDEADANQTLDSTDYEVLPVDKFVNKISYVADTPKVKQNSNSAVVISITTGFATGKVPKAIQNAILLIMTDLYENREDRVNNLPSRSQSLLRKYRFYY